jgi:hypothetical protein
MTAKTVNKESYSWIPGIYHCIGCGILMDESGIICCTCEAKGNLFTRNETGLNPLIHFFCDGCGVKMETPGVDRCDKCKEELRKYLS